MVHIRYVERDIPVSIPERNIIFDLGPRDVPPAADLGRKLQEALASPIATPPLHEMAKPGLKITFIVDDNTRFTPTKQIISVVLDELNRVGVPDDDIKDKLNITLATEGLSPELCQSMGFRHVWPDELNGYLSRRVSEAPDTTIGILRQSAEVLPNPDPCLRLRLAAQQQSLIRVAQAAT